jgi:hypothetical protein
MLWALSRQPPRSKWRRRDLKDLHAKIGQQALEIDFNGYPFDPSTEYESLNSCFALTAAAQVLADCRGRMLHDMLKPEG